MNVEGYHAALEGPEICRRLQEEKTVCIIYLDVLT